MPNIDTSVDHDGQVEQGDDGHAPGGGQMASAQSSTGISNNSFNENDDDAKYLPSPLEPSVRYNVNNENLLMSL